MSDPSVVIRVRCTKLPEPHRREKCRSCPSDEGYLSRYVHANGAVAIRWVCDRCEDFKTAPDLPRSVLRGTPIERIPLRRDNSLQPRSFDPCVVCGDDALHSHHWAPVAIFPDWPWGLVVPLCIVHHDEWHARMRAHGLRWPHELARAV